jgi:hypothetical protein
MRMRRFTRLINAFSKNSRTLCIWSRFKVSGCNFVRVHKTLRMTPAMAASVTDRPWSMEDIAMLVEAAGPKPNCPKT